MTISELSITDLYTFLKIFLERRKMYYDLSVSKMGGTDVGNLYEISGKCITLIDREINKRIDNIIEFKDLVEAYDII